MNTITDYRNALKEIKKFDKIQDENRENFQNQEHELYCKYLDLQRALDDKKAAEHEEIKKKIAKCNEVLNSGKKASVDIIHTTERVFRLIDVYVSEKPELKFEDWSDKTGRTIIDTLCDDEYKKAWIYICESRKPKNKFALKLRTKSIFQYQFDEFRKYDQTIKECPTEEELKKWYGKNKGKIQWRWMSHIFTFAEYVEKHVSLEKEYQEAIVLSEKKVWLRGYWEHQKHYFEEHVCRGTDTEEYKKVLKILSKL